MSQHHSEHNTQHYYEGDQSKLYSGVMNHHYGHDVKSESSKKQIKRILKVTVILSVVTILEVSLGLLSHSWGVPKGIVNTMFMIMTLLKAAYIVRVFMHLGDELSNFLITMMIPLTLFIWFIIAFLADGGFWLHMNQTSPQRHTQQIEAQR
jgi:cytochrome c oxidase subunit IV